MIASGRNPIWIVLLALAAAGPGCVERTLRVHSDPPGALVYMNFQEVGRTPFQRDFTWYGTYDVQVRRDGYETLNTRTKVIAPWWQWPPIDLIAELLPLRLKDERTIHYVLEPSATQPADPPAMLERAVELRGQLQGRARDRSAPPATAPAPQP